MTANAVFMIFSQGTWAPAAPPGRGPEQGVHRVLTSSPGFPTLAVRSSTDRVGSFEVQPVKGGLLPLNDHRDAHPALVEVLDVPGEVPEEDSDLHVHLGAEVAGGFEDGQLDRLLV